jgi:DNA polymerase III delta prime subunit
MTARYAPIICLEGPPAVGKTSLARALARDLGAVAIEEIDATHAPKEPRHGEPWFSERAMQRWQRALSASAEAPLVVLDTDPWKGVWYNWLHADEGWPQIDIVEPLLDTGLVNGRLGLPDLYLILETDVASLRARKVGDPTRTRRNHERHVARLPDFTRYVDALQAVMPLRVQRVPTAERGLLVPLVRVAVSALPASPMIDEGRAVLGAISDWVRSNSKQ